MPWPTLTHIRHQAINTFRRFPFVILAAFVAFGAASHNNHYGSALKVGLSSLASGSILWAAILGISLLLAISLISEFRWSRVKRPIPHLIGVVLIILGGIGMYYSRAGSDFLRYFHVLLFSHLLVAIAPLFGPAKTDDDLWAYNQTLFFRLLISGVYSVSVGLGLLIAVGSYETLFSGRVPNYVYGDIWFFVLFIFNTYFFLAGVPRPGERLALENNDPLRLKAFVQYVLLPLIVIYGVILYLYMGKVIWTRQWPKGTIGWLVSLVSVLGTLCWLFLYPLRRHAENVWIKICVRWFFRALLPLLVLLGLAVGRRITEYGITEPRYVLLTLCVWTAGIALWSTFRKSSGIRHIPVTLAILALVTAFGPWSSASVSRHVQQNRFTNYLTQAGIWREGKIQKAGPSVSWDLRYKISRSVDYLLQYHGPDALMPIPKDMRPTIKGWETFSLKSGPFHWRGGSEAVAVVEALGLSHLSRLDKETDGGTNGTYRQFTAEHGPGRSRLLSTAGYTHVLTLTRHEHRNNYVFTVDRDTYTVTFSSSTAALALNRNGNTLLETSLVTFAENLRDNSSTPFTRRPDAALTFSAERGPIRLRLVAQIVETRWQGSKLNSIQSVEGFLLLDLPKQPSSRKSQ